MNPASSPPPTGSTPPPLPHRSARPKLHGLITDKAHVSADVDVTGKVSIYLPANRRDG